ncbi:CPBP family intramembrane glutamic endopeptidase [Streptococcus porcinus]|uniref:CPBP family intramembrane glutamic endopeptidase n=1 Tax=Streptococcus porcinus TaxID=1340 RepID=UPI001961C815|nr:type II CAAX endopeptidase family protein [Streptococcus porcinus]
MRVIVNKSDFSWALIGFLALFLGAFFWGVVIGLIFRTSEAITLSVMIGGGLTSFFTLWYGYCYKNKWNLADLGFHKGEHSLWNLIWWVPITFIFSISGSVLLSFLLGVSHNTVEGGVNSGTMHLGWGAVVAMELTVGILIPFVEEIIFRRFLFDWFKLYFPTWLAASAVVILFAGMHVISAVVIYVLFLGISLMLSRIWFQNLTAPWIIHMINNSIVVLFATLG